MLQARELEVKAVQAEAIAERAERDAVKAVAAHSAILKSTSSRGFAGGADKKRLGDAELTRDTLVAKATRLRDSLELLNTLIRKDHKLLERMTEATGRAVRELTRIRDRHGLGGLYESSGSPRKQDVARPQQVDQSI